MKIRRCLLFSLCLFFLLIFNKKLQATHIVGGEMTYRCLGNDRYEIKLQVFRDCYTGVPDFDTIAWVAIYDVDWKLRSTLLMRFNKKRDTLPIVLTNPCLAVPPNVCVNTTTYLDTITLPYRAGGYTLVYQRCCRNNLIRNIYDPLDTGASFLVQITDHALQQCNRSPTFKTWPPVAICVNNPIDFDHGATDADGDSIVYKLCTPLKGGSTLNPLPMPPPPGPYPPVNWINPPYSLDNVLGGDPMRINPKTGFITGTPNTIGNFVVGICMEEYRHGKLLSVVRRDFQYNVADCRGPVAAFFAPEYLCESRKLKFINKSANAASPKWTIEKISSGGFAPLTLNEFAPTLTFPDTGDYRVQLVVNSTNGTGCLDTFSQVVKVRDKRVRAGVQLNYPDCRNGLTLAAADFSTDTVFGLTAWEWTLRYPNGTTNTSSQQNPQFLITTSGLHSLQLIATSANGCRDTVVQRFAPPFAQLTNLPVRWEICQGDTVALNPQPTPGLSYLWSPAQSLNAATLPNPLAFPKTTTVYTVVATSLFSPCTDTGRVTVSVLNPGTLTVSADPTRILVGGTTQLLANMPGVTQYTWDYHPSLSATNIPDPKASPTDTTWFFVTATLSGGCVVRDSILVPVIFPYCDEPFVFLPNAFSPNGDGENDVLKMEGIYISEVYWVIFSRWGEKIFEAHSLDATWDGTYKGQPMPPETLGFYYRVRCPNGTSTEKKGNITLLR